MRNKFIKRVVIVLLALLLIGVVGWQFRIQLILATLPTVLNLSDPIGPHVPPAWAEGPNSAEAAPKERPPNVIVILIDDLGWNDLSLNGGIANGTIPTPNIDSIAHDGINFINGYAGNAVCSPSRAAFMSGRYPTRFGFEFTPTLPQMGPIVYELSQNLNAQNVVQNRLREGEYKTIPLDDQGLPASEITIAETVKKAGYYTAHIGKWHLGYENDMAPHKQGFDDSLIMTGGLYLPTDHPEVVNAPVEHDPIDQFVWRRLRYSERFNGSDLAQSNGYLTDYYSDEAIKVIENNRHQPFFLFLSYWGPHIPLQATQADYDAVAHIDNHIERTYAAMVLALDRGIGNVLDALRDNGLEENTLVIFSSDNGAPHYLGIDGLNAPYRGWKLTLFEGGIKIPYMMKWPKMIMPGQTFTQPVHHFDIYATVAAATGAPLPTDRPMDGVDLMPYILGERTEPPHETLFWVQGHYQAVQANGWKLQVNGEGDEKRRWLFHLAEDPTEQINLAEQNPEKVAELEAMLITHLAEQATPLWDWSLETVVPVDQTLLVPIGWEDEYVYFPN